MLNKFLYILRKKSNREMEEGEITREKLDRMVKDGAILIDVRSPQEYNEGHLQGAISIPEYELKQRKEELPKNIDTKIILYCSTGRRSKKGKNKLEKMGYKNVYNLYNGI